MSNERYSRIVVAGHPGSGKTTFAKLLAKELGSTVLNSGDALREVLAARGVNVADRLATGAVFLRELGEGAAGEAVLRCARQKRAIVVEGLRLFSMYGCFLTAGERVLLVFVTVREDVRRKRFCQRLTAHEGVSESAATDTMAFKDAYWAEIERFRQAADLICDNSGPLSDLKMFVGEVCNRFKRRERTPYQQCRVVRD